MNKVFLVGRCKDIIVSTAKNGSTRAQFKVAVKREYESPYPYDYVPVACWDKLAENLAKYCYNDREIAVTGFIQTRTYKDDNGENKWILGIQADKIEFLGEPRKENIEPRHEIRI